MTTAPSTTTPRDDAPARPATLRVPPLVGAGILGANLFGLLGLAVLLTGGLAPAEANQDTVAQPVAPPSAFATADSNDRMIAVTGVDITGSSVLYLIDTEAMHMACYQATGGARSTQNLKLIGARRIDLDLQLVAFKDESEYTYEELERQFRDIPVDDDDDRSGE